MNKKIKIFLLCFFTFIFLCQGLISAQINLELPNISGQKGQSVEAGLVVSDLTGKNITAFQCTLYYDKNIIRINKASIGELDGMSGGFFTYTTDTVNGQITVAFASAFPLAGYGKLLNFHTDLINSGITKLSFTNPLNSNKTFIFNAGELSTNILDGQIIVSGLSISIANVSITDTMFGLVNIPISVTDFNDIGAFSLRIFFNASVVEFSSINNIKDNLSIITSCSNGILTLGWFDITGNSPLNFSNGKLLDINFRYLGGYTNLSFSKTESEIDDSFGKKLEVNYLDGSITSVVSVKNNSIGNIDEYKLEQNYPNPFNPVTSVLFYLPADSFVDIFICDILGKEIVSLISEERNKGIHKIIFDGENFSTGIYLLKLIARNINNKNDIIFIDSIKLLLMK